MDELLQKSLIQAKENIQMWQERFNEIKTELTLRKWLEKINLCTTSKCTCYPIDNRNLVACLSENMDLLEQYGLVFVSITGLEFRYCLEYRHGNHEYVRCEDTDNMWNDNSELGLFVQNRPFSDFTVSEDLMNLDQDIDALGQDKVDNGKRVITKFHIPCMGIIMWKETYEEISQQIKIANG